MGIKDILKKKGAKLNILSIPTQPTPFDIEHKIRGEFQRHRVVHTLRNVETFLLDLQALEQTSVINVDCLLTEVRAVIKEILAYKS